MSDHALPATSAVSMTIHLTAADRELLEGLSRRRDLARAQFVAADHDFIVAGIAMATSRGLRRAEVHDLTDRGLVVSIPAGPVVPADSTRNR